MKKHRSSFLDLVALVLGKALGIVWHHGLRRRAKVFSDCVFTHSVAGQFRRLGKGVRMSRSVSLLNPQYVEIGDCSTIWERTAINAWDRYGDERYTPSIVIGTNTSIGADCHITAIQKIVLGDGVLLGKKITITDNSHGTCTAGELHTAPSKRPLASKGPVVIEDRVWIGEKATILPGVRVGQGAIVAANAVVTKDVPDGCVVAGAPARVIKNMLEPDNT